MKYLTVIFFSLVFVLTSCGNKSHPDSDLTIDVENLLAQDSIITVQVLLINDLDTVTLTPYCGFIHFTGLFYFKVVKVIEGRYDLPAVPIVVSCPREVVDNKGLMNDKLYTYKIKRTYRGERIYLSITATDNFTYYILENITYN